MVCVGAGGCSVSGGFVHYCVYMAMFSRSGACLDTQERRQLVSGGAICPIPHPIKDPTWEEEPNAGAGRPALVGLVPWPISAAGFGMCPEPETPQ